MQSSLPQTTTPLPSDPTIPSSSPLAMAATCDLMSTAVTVPVSSVVECAPAIQTDIPDGDIQAAILDNLFVNYSAGGKSPKSTQLFHTSSDTVDQLLRGLNTRTQSDSIQKLSRETASVLPTFARVLESSVSFQSPSSPANASVGHDGGGSVSSEKGAGEEGEEEEEEGREGGSDIGEDEREPTPAGMKYIVHVRVYNVQCIYTCTCIHDIGEDEREPAPAGMKYTVHVIVVSCMRAVLSYAL